ncbi:MAG TPA: HAD family phosphatase [Rhodospirillaceae bacterium]|nr:HAD family phosphatase [Rhodospirillaceae bacterium]
MLRFVFWDCDNTLVENAALHWKKHEVTLIKHGYHLPADVKRTFYHNNGNQNWQWMVDHIGLTIPCEAYLKEVDAWYHANVHEVPFRGGIPWALDYFKRNDVKQCVVTNARRASVEPMLEVKGISPYFEFTWCKENYTARKPDPMPYLSALENMERVMNRKIDKAECLAIEDDPLGVTAAHLAGIPVIQRRYERDEFPSPDADISVFDEDDFIAAIRDMSFLPPENL